MREIKFRAWDEIEKWMGQVTSIDYEEESIYIDTRYLEDENQFKFDEAPLMQYTGLKDKNGVEVYEGDILTSKQYPFQDDGEYNYHGVVEWIDYLASFYLTKRLANKNKRGISDGISEQIEHINRFEVIGNIYEHPHLLEDK